MKKTLIIILSLFISICLTACPPNNDSGDSGDNGDNPKMMYIGGYEYNSSDKMVATYWKVDEQDNIETVSLSDGTNDARVEDVFVDGNGVVYSAGYFGVGSNINACYWKDDNGDITEIILDDFSIEAKSIYVDENGIVYVAGMDFNTNYSLIACYWEDDNGTITKTELTDGTNDARATSITKKGSKLYISGLYNISDGSGDPVYWVNDGTNITDNILTEGSETYSIFVDDNDIVYVAGRYSSTTSVACYWKDESGTDTKTDLHNTSDSEAFNVYVNAGIVYVGGGYNKDSILTACYWKDEGGTVSKTDMSNGTKYSKGRGMAVDNDGVVYLAGDYDDGSSTNIACYWKDDKGTITEHSLTDGTNSAKAHSIYVKSQ